MKINIHPPQCLNEIGQRENNEDSIWPMKSKPEIAAASRLFLVCDGVGGTEKGEVAGLITCSVISDYLQGKETIDAIDIDKAVLLAETRIANILQETGSTATTLTLLHLGTDKVTVAHIGDSRIYQFRNGKILFKTSDHSFVNELVIQKIITEEEARTHPKRNVVTKAVTGEGAHERAEINHILDVMPGDTFFLCSDGITESLTDEDLKKIIGKGSLNNTQKIDRIKQICNENSRDNFSAYLLQVDSMEGIKGQKVHTFLEKKRNKIWGIAAIVLPLTIGLLLLCRGLVVTEEEVKERKIKNSLNLLEEIEINDIVEPNLGIEEGKTSKNIFFEIYQDSILKINQSQKDTVDE